MHQEPWLCLCALELGLEIRRLYYLRHGVEKLVLTWAAALPASWFVLCAWPDVTHPSLRAGSDCSIRPSW